MIVDDYMLDTVLDRIKETIGIETFDDTKLLVDRDDKLSDYITFKNVAILMKCITKAKDNGKFYQQLFLEEVLFLK